MDRALMFLSNVLDMLAISRCGQSCWYPMSIEEFPQDRPNRYTFVFPPLSFVSRSYEYTK